MLFAIDAAQKLAEQGENWRHMIAIVMW